ncbi:DUF2786 domain-containing protein [Neisseria iguanae]|uniref:Uncharacterized protein n=1 Tax=Neisseria iguanae TaxID=90242 RepID=A0A2P7U2K7_9NEIS|nr:DUF2786 domain-containing protein [Neisseria iguanae]PSJ81208.1 hypothetical protein C7N83_01940 [Neisseria iguanae]
MDKESALQRIKKCLALGKSSNEHEAAQALKHAQILMDKYGLTASDVELAEVMEHYIGAPLIAPQWHWNLVHLCAYAFGCERWHRKTYTGGGFVFCGINGRSELAAYAYEVLLRQLKAARRKYMKTELSRVRIGKNKTARADKFCEGWVANVRDTVQEFAYTEAEAELLARYKIEKYGMMKQAKTRDVRANIGLGDYWAGHDAADGVRLDMP